ncbi:hypothetical protein [Lysobacter gummosus]
MRRSVAAVRAAGSRPVGRPSARSRRHLRPSPARAANPANQASMRLYSA